MTEPPPVRPLQEEIALLAHTLQALRPAGSAGDPPAGPNATERGAAAEPRLPCDAQPDADPLPASDTSTPWVAPDPARSVHGCPQCGCGVPAVCSACPVCRGAGLVKAVRPDALLRLADLAAVIAELLRAAADPGPSDRPQRRPAPRAVVEDVPVQVTPTGRPAKPVPGQSATDAPDSARSARRRPADDKTTTSRRETPSDPDRGP